LGTREFPPIWVTIEIINFPYSWIFYMWFRPHAIKDNNKILRVKRTLKAKKFKIPALTLCS
jgi:hypothetical protein